MHIFDETMKWIEVGLYPDFQESSQSINQFY